ncbi:MAG: hypothetical protein PWQ29_333 [Verrucomicrobiota bacterium]|jgi:hypothetical protein|nr:hypothetical protein [Verrucomicrobiota bacterium]MDK2962939.1 hypothetical protein [Verrucomicrobiota bacterium]
MRSELLRELRHHGPFTLLGAAASVVIMMAVRHWFPDVLSTERAENLFEFSHPLHVVLSAMVTAAMYRNYRSKEKHSVSGLLGVVLVGYFGSIGIATVSDCIVPYWAELILGMEHVQVHLGITEMPAIINLAALLGIGAAFFSSKTYFPHAGHVLLSTMASLFHVLRSHDGGFSLVQGIFLILFLFIAVWVPCCFSDIAFPLFFTGNKSHPH